MSQHAAMIRRVHQGLEQMLEQMVGHQRARVLREAQQRDPRLTSDDVLQPDDHPALAADPRWNYEDGVLAGLLAAQIAVRAQLRQDAPLAEDDPAGPQ